MEWVNVWLPPALIIGVVLYASKLLANGLNKRIDDLRSEMKGGIANLRHQMQRENDALANKVDDLRGDVRSLTETVTKHISNLDIHSKR